MEQLNNENLNAVSGGASGGNNNATYVCFDVEYKKSDGRYDIQKYIKQQLRTRGVPESVVDKVPVMNPEKSYMSYGSGGLNVTWQPGWSEPQYRKTHD